MKRWWIGGLAGLLVLALGLGGWWWSHRQATFRGMVLEPPRPAPDFELQDASGRPFRLSAQRGRVVLLFFGYTHCPDVCPATLLLYRDLGRRLADRADRVRLVFVTVDPERDTPARLRDHLAPYGPHVVGLTGTGREMQPVWEAYGVRPQRVELPDSPLRYAVMHPSQVYLVDPAGRIRLLYPFGYEAADLEHDIRLILTREG